MANKQPNYRALLAARGITGIGTEPIICARILIYAKNFKRF